MDQEKLNRLSLRFKLLYFIYFAVAALFIYQIIYIQFISEERIKSDDLYKVIETEAMRGSILAHDGRPIATSIPYYEVRMDCVAPVDSVFNKYIKGLSTSLSTLFKDKSASAYEKEIKEARKNQKKYLRIGNRNISYTEMKELVEFPMFNLGKFRGGIILEESFKRVKPYGSLANRTIGFVNSDGGGVGIERSFDHYLKGRNGMKTIQRQVGGTWTTVLGEKSAPAINGMDIRTTLDIEIQEVAEKALREQLSKEDILEGGTAIVMEVQTGAIRAITNMKKTSNGTFDETYNYAIAEATAPGSTFKVATLMSLIEDGLITLNDKVDIENGRWVYAGNPFTDVTRPNTNVVTVLEAFEKSSNVAFAKIAVEKYDKKENDFVKRLHSLKITEKLGLDIMGEGNTYIQTPADKHWSKLSLPMLSIGYEVLLTPMHTLTFYNAIANNGKMMKPYFIESMSRDNVVIEQRTPQQISGSICSKKTLQEIRKALRSVVENGTGKAYDDSRYAISGKTGTAQLLFNGKYRDQEGNRKHQASFAGYFPSDNPKYTVIVVLYSGITRKNFYGGTWAAPVFKTIADNIYSTSRDWNQPVDGKSMRPEDNPHIASGLAKPARKVAGYLPSKSAPDIPDKGWISVASGEGKYIVSNLELDDNRVPDVTNMGLKDAVYILENEGYRVEFTGMGRVRSQSPEGGSVCQSKGVIKLQLGN